MAFTIPLCPQCGKPVAFILESVYMHRPIGPDGEYESAVDEGPSKVLWDLSSAVVDEDGLMTVLCEDEHAWDTSMNDEEIGAEEEPVVVSAG